MADSLVLYSRPGCHLCEEMKEIVRRVSGDQPCALREIDISADAALEATFGQEIPVLFINGRKAFKYRVSERELRRHLAHRR